MTKRKFLKNTNKKIDDVGKKGFISLGLAFLSLIFTYPIGETLFGREINIQSWASIVSIFCFLYFFYWLYLEIYKFYLEKTMTYEVLINGDTSRFVPEIMIDNRESVKIQDVYVEMILFGQNLENFSMDEKKFGNSINKFPVEDRFFSVGIPSDRSVIRSPIYVQIAEAIEAPNGTLILLDNHARPMRLDKQGQKYSKWGEYEFIFRVTGKFADENEGISFGDYYAVLYHEQVQEYEGWEGGDIFKWKVFEKADKKRLLKLRLDHQVELAKKFFALPFTYP